MFTILKEFKHDEFLNIQDKKTACTADFGVSDVAKRY
jgi:hypothetical protein